MGEEEWSVFRNDDGDSIGRGDSGDGPIDWGHCSGGVSFDNCTPMMRSSASSSDVPLNSSLKLSGLFPNRQTKHDSWSSSTKSVSTSRSDFQKRRSRSKSSRSRMKTKQPPPLETSDDDKLCKHSLDSAQTAQSTSPSTGSCTSKAPQHLRRKFKDGIKMLLVAAHLKKTSTVKTEILPILNANDCRKDEGERVIENSTGVVGLTPPQSEASNASLPRSPHDTCGDEKQQDVTNEKDQTIEKINVVKKKESSEDSIRSSFTDNASERKIEQDLLTMTELTATPKSKKSKKKISRSRSLSQTPRKSSKKKEVPESKPISILNIPDLTDKVSSKRSKKKTADVEGEVTKKDENGKLAAKNPKTVGSKKSKKSKKDSGAEAPNRKSKKEKDLPDGDDDAKKLAPVEPPMFIEFEVKPTIDDNFSVVTTPRHIRHDSDSDRGSNSTTSRNSSSKKKKKKKRTPLEPEGWRHSQHFKMDATTLYLNEEQEDEDDDKGDEED